MTSANDHISIYEMTLNARVNWFAHSLSNAGTDGSIRLLPRRQLLADGTETDACSGNIAKHYHAVLAAEHFEALGVPLCPACRSRDGRRAAALVGEPGYEVLTISRILNECGLCDTHGFLVTAKNATGDDDKARERISKHSLVEFSFALALPDEHAETVQLATRVGDSKEDGQMIMKRPSRSGSYALCVRYKSVGVGVDTNRWNIWVDDVEERERRHRAVLSALRDQILSPSGARTATMLPHLTGLSGVIAVRSGVGRAPMYSPLEADFIARLTAMESDGCKMFPFETVDGFNALMNRLIENSTPCLPTRHSLNEPAEGTE